MAVLRQASMFVGDVRGLAATGVRAARTRLELLAIELREEKAWLVRFLVLAVAALYLVTFGTILAVAALVLFAAEESRPLVLGIAAAVFVLGGVAAGLSARGTARNRRPLFAETVAVLKGDEQGLQRLRGEAGD